MINNIIKQKH